MRRVWVVAPELLMIDGLDLLTGLSTLAYLHSTTRSSRPDLAQKPSPDSITRWCWMPLMGYSPPSTRSITSLKGFRSEFRGMEITIMHIRPPTPDLYS